VGKRAVVIGSNNSAHDICAALWEAGADVTMVQRSSTHVVRSDTLMDLGLGDLYSERAVAAGLTTFKADTVFASLPFRILPALQAPVYRAIRERDAEYYRRLEQAGFDLDFGDDDSGLFLKYLRRGSGYYIDVGASELVANGDIKLAKGQVAELTEDEVVLGDGTSCATCGSRRPPTACGSTAATSPCRATTPCTWPCSSKPGWRGSPRPCTSAPRYTTPNRCRGLREVEGTARPVPAPRRRCGRGQVSRSSQPDHGLRGQPS
jgi:hypothetical protein